MNAPTILNNFDRAASTYDRAAAAQILIAKRLVGWAAELGANAKTVLDLGCGTGLVAEEALRRWPQCRMTAIDASLAMLYEAQKKLPQISAHRGNLLTYVADEKFDAIFCNMALHWLPEPLRMLRRWKGWLGKGGKLFAALPVDGSFPEWRKLCRLHKADHGLWPLPSPDFADGLLTHALRDDITVKYSSAQNFLRSMKATGAATPRPNHKPIDTATMRKMLKTENRNFPVTYRLLFLEISGSGP